MNKRQMDNFLTQRLVGIEEEIEQPGSYEKMSVSGTINHLSVNAGYEFVLHEDILIKALGRIVPVGRQMREVHDLTLWEVKDGAVLAQVSVRTGSNTDALGCKYENLDSPVKLYKGETYRLTSSESKGGDRWLDLLTIEQHREIATVTCGVIGEPGTFPLTRTGNLSEGFGNVTFYMDTDRDILEQPPNLTRLLPPSQAVYTSSSLQGYSMLGAAWHSKLGFPWNRVYLVDGYTQSDRHTLGWSSDHLVDRDHPEWVKIDMGAIQTITAVDLYPRNDHGYEGEHYPVNFSIEVSSDDSSWKVVANVENAEKPSGERQRFEFKAVEARYVRVFCTKLRPHQGEYRVQLRQIEIYNLQLPNAAPVVIETPIARTVTIGALVDEQFGGTTLRSGWDRDLVGADVNTVYPGNYAEMTRHPKARAFTAFRRFPIQRSGNLTVEYRFKLSDLADGIKIQLRNEIVPAIGFVIESGNLCYQEAGGNLKIVQACQPEIDYGMKIVADIVRATINVFINGRHSLFNASFLNETNQIDNFYIEIGGDSPVTVSLSPIRIYTGYLVFEQFLTALSGHLPDDWTSRSLGGEVGVYSLDSYQGPDTYSLKLKDTSTNEKVTVQKSFTASSGHAETGASVWEYKFLLPVKMDGIESALLADSKSAIAIVTYQGAIAYLNSLGQPVPLYRYRHNVWYHMKVVVRFEAATADIYINGKMRGCGVELAARDISYVNQVRFSTSIAAEGDLFLDDILIYEQLPEPDDYVPEPEAASHEPYLLGMQQCSLWREGTCSGYDPVRNNLDRKPVLGWYNEGDLEAVDWEIKYLVEHGIDFLQYCWFGPTLSWRSAIQPIKDTAMTKHALHDGFFYAKYSKRLKFSILWENSDRGIDWMTADKKEEYFKENVFPYWMEYYFKDERYLKVGNKPVLSIYRVENLIEDFGDSSYVKQNIIQWMREQFIQEGFAGVILLCNDVEFEFSHYERIKECGFDYVFSYGQNTQELQSNQKAKAESVDLQMIGVASTNWSIEAWDEPGSYEGYQRDPELFEQDLKWMRNHLMPSFTDNSLGRSMLFFDNWNEYGEGHIIMPTEGMRFAYLDAIRRVFANAGPHKDIVPTALQKSRFDTLYPHGDW
ncbi:discoidin domain-containing protein [Cohnella phaseoli]|uniref:Glycosyl transferase family WbsX n=1 Tax=Cohnella phaseoli TaxID=456490 RepID=A0A3D9KG20_9BACL|nr:discoidin domain-containing protein [Cohnella phaseoli]RED85415.1 glycosyl transferase family WbsX [Cohnella phaseoli]